MQVSKVIDPKRKRIPSTYADHLRKYFCGKPFDITLAAYFPADIIDKHDLTSAPKTVNFTRGRLKSAGYRGYYVIVVHDKRGSTLWHPHMLLDGRFGNYDKVRRALFPVADINYKTAGKIDDLKQCAGYMAMRACEQGPDSTRWEFDFMGEHKKHRPRGTRGKGRGRSSSFVSTKDVHDLLLGTV